MTDALDREGVEQALRASEERYRTLFDSIDQGFCTVEVIFDERRRPVDYLFLEVNRAFEKLTGLTGAVGKRMRALRPDHEEHWFATYGRIATTGRPERFVSEAAALGRWYNVYAFRLDEPARHRVGILFEDITERKRAETALRESEQRFRAFVSASSEVVYRMSPDWSQMRELDGQRFLAGTSEPTEHWMEEYILPEDRVAVREAIDRAIRTKSLFELEHRVRRADGTIGWTFSRAAPVLDEGGQIIEWLGAASDMTSRHRTESLFRSLFESIDEGVMVIERAPPRSDGLRDWRYLAVNERAALMFGKPDLTGQTIRANFPDEDEAWYDIYDQVLATGEGVRFERESVPQDMVIEMFVTRVGTSDAYQLVAVTQDVTQRRRMTDALHESEARQAFLLKLSDALRSLADPVEIQSEAMRVLGEQLGAIRAQYWEAEPDDEHFVSDGGYANGMERISGRARMADFGAHVQEALAAGRTLAIADAATDPRVSQAELAAYDAFGFRAYIGVPLVKAGRLVAALGLYRVGVHHWSDSEIGLAEETAERTWAAVERARAEAALRESEEKHRLIVENARDYAIIVTDPEGRITEWMPGAEAVFGWTAEEAVGQPLAMTFTPQDRAEGEPEREIGTAAREGEAPDVRWHQRQDGGQVFIDGAMRPLYHADGSIRGYLKIGQDVSERRNAQVALEASEQRMRTLATGIPQLVFRSLGDGHRIWGSPQWIEYTDLSFEDSLGFGWLDRVHPDDRTATMDAWDGVEERGEYYVEHRICDAASRAYRWHQTRAAPLRDEQGRILEWLGTSTEVEELRQLQRHQQTLLAELQHRVRNTLGVVRSIARRTAERSGTVEEMSSHFQGRLDAFSRVQAAVTRNPEAGVDLKSLIEDELLAHAAREGESLIIEGPAVSLKARAAESISLAVHELTTNAVKYGALSDGDGRIAVRWERVRPDGREVLRLVWEENGVELPPEPPTSRGFGLELLQRSLPYDLRAETRVDFRREGLRFEMEMPLDADVLAPGDGSD